MIYEDIAPDFNAKEISYKGYTTKNLHHSQDALNAFNATIQRVKKGLIHDSGAILRALKSTDAYMKLNDMHLQQQRAESPEEVTQWAKEHQKAATALKTLNGEFAHHYDYWNNHRQELQLLQANASINNPMGESYMQHIINGNPFQDVLDELSTELLGRYKKSAAAQASDADKSGDFKTGNKRFSGIMKATKKQFANDAKKSTNEETVHEKQLTPAELKKREEIALALERDQPGINKGKKYAIATAVAKRVAESSEIDEAIKGWKHAHNDLAKIRASASDASKSVKLVRLNKSGSESKLHDAEKPFKSEEEAHAYHSNLVKLNPGKGIAHNLYVNGEHKGTLKESMDEAAPSLPKGHQVWQNMNAHEKGEVMDKVGYKGSITKTHKACIDHINKNIDQYKKFIKGA